jgi:Tfp pilus assembly protein PilV
MVVKKIAAFTILETIVALLIIVTMFGIVSLVCSRVLDTSNLNEHLEAHLMIQDYAIATKTTRDFTDGKYESNKYDIIRSLDYYKGNRSLLLITIKATDQNGKLIETYHEIIIASHEKD